MFFELAVPSFVAGFLTFLAPCTLPLVPGYLAFISGVSIHDAHANQKDLAHARRKILWNALFYVLGFSAVFIAFGTIFSGIGALGFAAYRIPLMRISGVLIIILGIAMTGLFELPAFQFLNLAQRFSFARGLSPGKPLTSFLFGATFALGWTPCIGPTLGTILLLASTSGTVFQGGLLLAIFSLGLAVPYFLVALGIEQAMRFIQRISKYLRIISIVGGVLIALIGLMLVTGTMGFWTDFFYRGFRFIPLDRLFDYY